jgi:hypothetical protein
MKSKSYGSTIIKVKTGLARHRQIVAEGWKSERHEDRPGTARQPVAARPGKRGRGR